MFQSHIRVLKAVYSECRIQGVVLSGTILKPNMVLPGKESRGALADEVAKLTCEALQQNVPKDVAGIASSREASLITMPQTTSTG